MGLVDKVKVLDNFLNERYLEREFTKERFEYYEIHYDGKSINTESYVQTHSLPFPLEEVIEIDMIFEEYQITEFKSALKNLKIRFVEDYIASPVPLVEKIAFAMAFNELLTQKFEIFRNHKTGRKFGSLLFEFINELSIEFIETGKDKVDNPDSKKTNSFKYLHSHRATLSKLFKALIDHELIRAETDEVDFIKIFQNKEIDYPILWTGQTSELKYFIELINTKEFGFVDRGDFKWRIAVKCFVKVGSRSLKTITYKDLRTYKVTPNTRTKLDNILVKKILKI